MQNSNKQPGRKPYPRRKASLPASNREVLPDIVEQYARDVVSGAEVARPLVRLAGKRHLDDLVNGPSRGLKWDQETAKDKLQFFPSVLRLAGGEHEGRAFDLHVSQAFIVGNIF